MHRLGNDFAGQQGLRGRLQHHRIARDQGGHDGIESRQVGIIPRRDDENDTYRGAFDAAFKAVAVLGHQGGQGGFCDASHVIGPFIDAAEFAAPAGRAAH